MTTALHSQAAPGPEPAVSDGMSLADLHILRGAVPGCEAAVLVDLAAGTVLGVGAGLALPQEHYDDLASEAAWALSSGDNAAEQALLVRPTGQRLFVRAPGHPDEVLCLVLARFVDAPAILPHVTRALAGQLQSGRMT